MLGQSMLAKNKNAKNKGQVLVLVALSLVAFMGLAALAIDLAYFFHIKHQLQGAADAAALAGASQLTFAPTVTAFGNHSSVRREAWKFACKNRAAGDKVFLEVSAANCDPVPSLPTTNDGDIVVGHWNGSNVVNPATGETVDAVKVIARRKEGAAYSYTGGGVTRFFGRIFTQTQQDLWAQAIAIRKIGTVAPLSVNEYWCGDNPSSCSDEGLAPYPNSFFRFNNISSVGFGGKSSDWCPPHGSSTNPWCATHPDQGLPLAIAGANAVSTNQPSSYKGFPALDYRVNSYLRVASESWYAMPNTSLQINENQVNTGIGDWAPYLNDYPYEPPITVTELFIKDYATNNPINPYTVPPPATNETSSAPFATVAYNTGVAVGQTVTEMIDSGRYVNGRYAPGKDVVVLVYDGLVQGSAQLTRVTIMGYAKMRIIGYGNSLDNAITDPYQNTGNSAYAYALEPLKECNTVTECKQILVGWSPITVRLVE